MLIGFSRGLARSRGVLHLAMETGRRDGLRFQTDGRQATEVMVWTTAATGIEYLRVVAAVTPHAGSYRDGDCYRRS
jgi:hypothetical protein